jgi:hypothetical protein
MINICLSLLGSPELEEKVLDHLLFSPHTQTFTSQACASHGGCTTDFDASEQVLGRANAVLIQVLLDSDKTEPLLDDLKRLFPGSGLRFWLTPVLQEGYL